MTPHRLTLKLLTGSFAVCRLTADAPVPPWAAGGPFVSISRTAEELSVVCRAEVVPEGVPCERGWRCLRVVGTLDFALVGVLVSLVVPLAEAGVSVSAISTFDTDYLFVRGGSLETAVEALGRAGHRLLAES
jgi:hypothetical protein